MRPLLSALSSPTPPPVAEAQAAPLDTLVTLDLGEERTVGGIDLAFVNVEEDSRCPVDVTCVWAGQAIVEVRVDGASRALLLSPDAVPEAEPGREREGEFYVALVALTPAPGTAEAEAGATPRALLEVRRR